MKTNFISLSLAILWSCTGVFAQDKTTVTAQNSEISDNLDLRAVASIFGDSKNLEDFESRLNDPSAQISNLDLNEDNQVDYLRVIETVEGNAHIIVIQSVLGKDTYQDVATVEVSRDQDNRVQVQVVGDVYMYGSNYIYEPEYSITPVIYASFWVGNYRPYYSGWYWGYYPTYYHYWSPFSIFRYRSHIGIHININHHYNYSHHRRCEVAYNSYRGRRAVGYETRYPDRSFSDRNSNYTNRYDLDRTRTIRNVGRNSENQTPRTTRGNTTPRSIGNTHTDSPRSTSPNESPRNATPRNTSTNESPRNSTPRNSSTNEAPRSTTPRTNNRNSDSPRTHNETKGNSTRSEGNSGGRRK